MINQCLKLLVLLKVNLQKKLWDIENLLAVTGLQIFFPSFYYRFALIQANISIKIVKLKNNIFLLNINFINYEYLDFGFSLFVVCL